MVNPKKRPNKNLCLGRGSDLPRILESGSLAEKRHWGSWDGPMWGVNSLNCLKQWAPPKVGNNYFITLYIYICIYMFIMEKMGYMFMMEDYSNGINE